MDQRTTSRRPAVPVGRWADGRPRPCPRATGDQVSIGLPWDPHSGINSLRCPGSPGILANSSMATSCRSSRSAKILRHLTGIILALENGMKMGGENYNNIYIYIYDRYIYIYTPIPAMSESQGKTHGKRCRNHIRKVMPRVGSV